MRQGMGIIRAFVTIEVHGATYVKIENTQTHELERFVCPSGTLGIERCIGKAVYFQCDDAGILTDLTLVTVPAKARG